MHPGYGFLSEKAAFARALRDAKIAFIGPSPEAMEALGDKIAAKKLAAKAKVSTVPGHAAALEDAEAAVTAARAIGYPVMLKASAGGGGKGMRIADNDAECREGFARATSEARSSFGDDRVFAEKYVRDPRHIEIQIMGDSHGNVVYLGERECSLQRRHQKVIEEAPSPFLDAKTRKAMGEQAVALAKAVGYTSAGTVEFIVDSSRNFYFLEMNTRLQVEHPVTEMISGLDLVELMIRIAAGERLPFAQKDVKLAGWSIEARVYAEDPFRKFLPSVGRLTRYRPPRESEDVRVDTGIYEGGEISIHYDPMIAKVVTRGRDRAEAIGRMARALDEFHIRGVSHNIPFLASLMAHSRFKEGRLSTGFIAEEYPHGFHPADAVHDRPSLLAAAAASIHHAFQERAALIEGQLPGHERRVSNEWMVRLGEAEHRVSVARFPEGFEGQLAGRPFRIRTGWRLGEPLFEGDFDGEPLCLQVERIGIAYRLSHAGTETDALVFGVHMAPLWQLMPAKKTSDTSKFLLSPMPGLLVKVSVVEGQEVKAGEELAVIEAMKMENVLRAERDGTVAAVKVKSGDSLAVDQVILEFR
ncbi:MAG: acetyl/propionyl-CoA carboxylase subuit alpha [Rhodospirillales bacterium RIFCSPLOWO2_12_FULL_67_15]|nr:MAG: acetyl/propionyl-CoA carboxylase subuit alpha [Rhodospirillales bacterium RIFCSPLOWO2_12_FULL_67_15]